MTASGGKRAIQRLGIANLLRNVCKCSLSLPSNALIGKGCGGQSGSVQRDRGATQQLVRSV